MDTLNFLYYLAGIVDGEGCFVITINKGYKQKTYPAIHLKIASTDKDLLEFIQTKLKELGIVANIYPYHNKKGTAAYGLWVYKLDMVTKTIDLLKDKLVLKKKDLEVMEKIREMIESKRIERGGSGGLPFTAEEIIRIVELRDTLGRKKGKIRRDKNWYMEYFKNVPGGQVRVPVDDMPSDRIGNHEKG